MRHPFLLLIRALVTLTETQEFGMHQYFIESKHMVRVELEYGTLYSALVPKQMFWSTKLSSR